METPTPIVIPADCYIGPTEPESIDAPAMQTLPAPADPSYWPLRAQNAEQAGLFFQRERDAERSARVINSIPQVACAEWAERQDN